MPLFYFDLHDNSGVDLRDDEGLAFSEMKDACQEALRTLCERGRDLYENGPQEIVIIIREARTRDRLRVTLSLSVDREQ